MKTKLTTDNLPLIIICIIVSMLLIILFAKSIGTGIKKSKKYNVKIINIPFIALYSLPLIMIAATSQIIHIKVSKIIKLIYILVSAIIILIPIVYNVSKLGISGLSVSFFQATCGLMLGAIALASAGIAIIMLAVAGIGSGLGGTSSSNKTIRSVNGSEIEHIHEWGDGYYKDDHGNVYYDDGNGRWRDDNGDYYVE